MPTAHHKLLDFIASTKRMNKHKIDDFISIKPMGIEGWVKVFFLLEPNRVLLSLLFAIELKSTASSVGTKILL